MSVQTDPGLMESAVEIPEPNIAQGAEVEAILRDAFSPKPEETLEPSKEPAAPPPPEKWDLASVAEKLQVKPEKLYELKFKTVDGSETSLSEIKDSLKSHAEVTKARAELEADRIAAQRELSKLYASIPKEQVRPELTQAFEAYQADQRSREREALLRTIPEWSDTGVVTAERKQIQDYIEQFGFPRDAIEYVEDHRLFRLTRQAMKDQQELKVLKAKAAEAEKPKAKVASAPTAGRPTEAQKFGQLKAAVTSRRVSPEAAVEQILRGQRK